MASVVTVLNFRDTPVWAKYRNDPDGMPGADKVEYFLVRNGIMFDKEGGDGVAVKADGTVIVTSQNDPSLVWPNYDDAPSLEGADISLRLRTIRNLRDKLRDGTASAAERDKLIVAVATGYLSLYKEQP